MATQRCVQEPPKQTGFARLVGGDAKVVLPKPPGGDRIALWPCGPEMRSSPLGKHTLVGSNDIA
jgi:hypothetical protein